MTDAANRIFQDSSGQPARRHAAGPPHLLPWRRRGAAGSPRGRPRHPVARPSSSTATCAPEVTTGIAQRLLDLTGEAPSVVIAEYDREYIDANRPAACAFEPVPESDARRLYDEYHNTIRLFVEDIRAENGGLGLLFDIHGTGGIDETPAPLPRTICCGRRASSRERRAARTASTITR
jgi:hypothetical protein